MYSPLNVEFTVVLPCLDEAETLAVCIRKALASFAELGVEGEVVVADNGSTDGSQRIAVEEGARFVDVPTKGYGAALMGGIEAARGRYVIRADADLSERALQRRLRVHYVPDAVGLHRYEFDRERSKMHFAERNRWICVLGCWDGRSAGVATVSSLTSWPAPRREELRAPRMGAALRNGDGPVLGVRPTVPPLTPYPRIVRSERTGSPRRGRDTRTSFPAPFDDGLVRLALTRVVRLAASFSGAGARLPIGRWPVVSSIGEGRRVAPGRSVQVPSRR